MSREIILEALNGIRDTYIEEAAEVLGLLGEAAPATAKPPRDRENSLLYRFFNSGWGVAVICAVVSLSVLGGIIWAGQRPPVGGPGGIETETVDYSGESQDEVTVRHGDTVIYPKKFFLWSESDGVSADGEGFAETIRIDYNGIPVLPKVYYAKDGSISPCELNLTTGYEFSFVRIYDTDMQQSAVTYDGPFNYKGFLSVLPVGRYYVALQIVHNSSCYEYAYELVVTESEEEITTAGENGVETTPALISEERAMEIASAYWNIRTGDVDPDTGYTFRIQSMGKTQTPKGVAVYEIALRWLVEDSRYSTVETVWVDVDTGDMIIPYESETGSETRYIQFPLIKPDDTTSFISLTDGGADKCKSLQFLVLPADTEKPKLTELFGIGFKSPTDGEVNVQIVSYKSETEYGFLYMYESAHLDLLNNRGETRVTMNCVRVEFFSKRTSTKPYYDIPAVDQTLGVASFRYSPENKQSVLQSEYSNNYRALGHAEDLFEKYNDPEKYEYTILYGYVDGVETVNTPVESIPEFSYSIFKENAFDTQSPYPGQEEQETELIIPPENELYLSMLNNLRGTILTEGSNFTLPSTSMSGLASPYFVAAVTKPYADFTVTLGLDSNALETTLLFDHHRSQVVLTLHEDNSMTIRVLSKDNYEHEETIMPGAISEEPLFQDKNVSYSNTEHEYAPRYFLFYAMYYMDAFMGELNDEFSFEALGFTYADYQAYEHHLYS